MTYKALFTRSFLREYRKLPQEVKQRIEEEILEIVKRPYSGTKLRGELTGYYRWKVGDYRIIYMIDEKNRHVVFVDVGIRRAIYD
ncbi:Toxin RelE [Candidatus Calditenuaceae archaeon HR02]|nr:Toxin RelE [Candidatus Calditenuaceae archaeon HR02]